MYDALRLAVTLVTLILAHSVADHWVQTHTQATTKGQTEDGVPTLAGLRALGMHALTHTLTLGAFMAVAVWRTDDLGWGWPNIVAGLLVNGLSHAWADHRPNLRALSVRLRKVGYYDMPGGAGSYQLDQAWHMGWLFLSGLVVSL